MRIPATSFDMSRTVEAEGEITRVQWRHPHVRYWVQADPAYGGAEWELETTPPSLLERRESPMKIDRRSGSSSTH